MRNIPTLLALLIALGLIVYLYLRLSAVEKELGIIQRRAADCEQVTFQLQNQLSAQHREEEAKLRQRAGANRQRLQQ